MKKIKFYLGIFFIFGAVFLWTNTSYADNVGDVKNFFVDDGYDSSGRTSINAILVRSTLNANIYADLSWWNFVSQAEAKTSIEKLGKDFDEKTYPRLTDVFGQEWRPGIDKDLKITILIESMKGDAGGYFRTHDEYPKILIPNSNEREMIYINAKYIFDRSINAVVAHEFTHLITFFQKNERFDVEDDVWIDEARAEYAPTLLGYNNNYEGNYLSKRIQYFTEKPTGSLTDWRNTKYDYGKASLFAHYLVDHYGINILVDSLQSNKTGVESINYALQKNGFKETFSEIFSDWTIAVLVNDCQIGKKYCYLDKNLQNFYLSPDVNFLPLYGNTTLTFSDNAKFWSGNWYKLIGGGGGILTFSFEANPDGQFIVPYLKKDKTGDYSLGFMELVSGRKGQISIENFGKETMSLFVLPVLYADGKSADNNLYHFSWSASIKRPTEEDPVKTEINRLLAIIENLKKQIADLQKSDNSPCPSLDINLYFGMKNSSEVKCLQKFLKDRGSDIYPEGLVTGNFGNLTKKAVIKFQEKYFSEILAPAGLQKGSGYVGSRTRDKINQILTGA